MTGLETERDIDRATQEIVTAILTAVGESTPNSRTGPRSIPGWTQECKEAQQLARRLRRHYQRKRTPEAWEAYRQARNQQESRKQQTPRGHMEAGEWARNREPRTTSVPPLQRPDGQMETDATKKLELFREAFFLPPLEVDLEDIKDYRYPKPLCFPPITLKEVTKSIKRTPGRKAPGKDTIPSDWPKYQDVRVAMTLVESVLSCCELEHTDP
ncbi:hypothetical protein CNMCM6069_008603 [Aspergillus lentulus]|nr:hypothetical protein CNMCM6069_008603 [Aspergillus lentulus]